MKTIAKSQVARQPENACFMAERLIMSEGKSSRWLAQLHESFQDEHFLYLVMEYFPGGDLNALDLEQKGLPEADVRIYAAEIVLALEELHQMGYVHRDVKPGNVMVREDGHVRLTDFGSAGKLDPSTGLVFSRTSVGTPDYISPEALHAQQSRNGAFYGREADWWGLGVLLWELLTGEPPFYAPSLVQTYQNIAAHATFLKFDSIRVSEEARALLRGLLCERKERLDAERIKAHPFFRGIEWERVHMAGPPMVPLLSSPEDTSRFYLDDDDVEDGCGSAGLSTDRKRTAFEGTQLPYVGFTHDPSRLWHLSRDTLPVLKRVESSRLRLEEVESQVAELRQSCDMARQVADQIKRVASRDSMNCIEDGTDELEAGYEALVQNYEFLQVHYESLLIEHADTSRQLNALLSALQEQEEAKKELESELVESQQRSSLDRVKINQLVGKLATMSLGPVKSVDRVPEDAGRDKQLLKQRAQECKRLEQQLLKEQSSRERLTQEAADLRAAKAALEREHEALLVEYRGNASPNSGSLLSSSPGRRPSDASTMLRSVLSLGRHHSRQPSALDSTGMQEGTMRVMDMTTPRKRGAAPIWQKTRLIIRETGVWLGDTLLASIRADLFWVQPVQPGELVGVPTRITQHTFKLRSIATWESQEPKISSLEEVKARLEKERRILQGAEQLLAAAKTAEQQTIAHTHIDTSCRLISQLEGHLSGQSKIDSDSLSTNGGHAFTLLPPNNPDLICDACHRPAATHLCPACDSHSHRECHGLIPLRCAQAAALRLAVPVYLQAGSTEEARKWMRAFEAARKLWTS